MMYLTGEQINIDIPTLRQLIGTRVEYLLERDIDKTGRGFYFPKVGIITEIVNRQVDFGNSSPEGLKSIREIVKL